MKIAKKDVNLLLAVLGVIVLLAAYFLLYTKFDEQAQAHNSRAAQLGPTLAALEEKQKNLDMYNASIEESSAVIDRELLLYKDDVRTEDMVMYAIKMEEDIGMTISTAAFAQPAKLSTFPAVIKGEDGEEKTVEFSAYKVNMTVSCKMSYRGMKDAVAMLYAAPDRTVLDMMNVSYDSENGGLTGTMTLSKIFLTDGAAPYVPTEVPFGQYGNTNPFGTITAENPVTE